MGKEGGMSSKVGNEEKEGRQKRSDDAKIKKNCSRSRKIVDKAERC